MLKADVPASTAQMAQFSSTFIGPVQSIGRLSLDHGVVPVVSGSPAASAPASASSFSQQPIAASSLSRFSDAISPQHHAQAVTLNEIVSLQDRQAHSILDSVTAPVLDELNVLDELFKKFERQG